MVMMSMPKPRVACCMSNKSGRARVVSGDVGQNFRRRRVQGPLRGLAREVEAGHVGVAGESIAMFEIVLIEQLEPGLVAGRETRARDQKLGGAGLHRAVGGDEGNRLHIAGPVPEILINRFGHRRR